nr:MAG TPA: hypothetical protein [Caudoviricetes sp.]
MSSIRSSRTIFSISRSFSLSFKSFLSPFYGNILKNDEK